MALICVLSSGPYTSKHIVIQKKIPSNSKAMAKHIWGKFGPYVLSHAIPRPNVTAISHIFPNVLAIWGYLKNVLKYSNKEVLLRYWPPLGWGWLSSDWTPAKFKTSDTLSLDHSATTRSQLIFWGELLLLFYKLCKRSYNFNLKNKYFQ